MTATSTTENLPKEAIMDDLSNAKPIDKAEAVKSSDEVDQKKMAELQAQLKAKQAKPEEKKMATKIVAKKERSIAFGFLGSGHAGSRLVESAHKLGYDAVVVNTAMQDLKFIDIPDSSKLLLDNGVGGAAKELEIGKVAAESHRGEILQLVNDKLANSQVNVLCFSLGGGSGAGSCETLVDILAGLGKPLVVITVLPMDTEDVQTKSNALETLSKLATFARTKKIANLIVVDNAKIESIYQDANHFDFFNLANTAIMNTLDVFNTMSAMPASSNVIDSMEWSKILMDGEGLSIYGEFVVENYSEDTAIAEAVVNNLNNNLLASGFDLKQSKYVGFILSANKDVWEKIPTSSINYATAMINNLCGSPKGVFKGVYTVDSPENVVKVYSFFSGLSLPADRIEQLKKETAEMQTKNRGKDEQRNLSLQLDTGTNETVSAAKMIKDRIAAKSSTFGKFVSGVMDRRSK
jgi:cell division GTPase FtsZ